MKTLITLIACSTMLTACAGLVPRAAGDAAVQQLVSEDDQVRITELRLRGQTQRISVDPKDSVAPRYEITPQAAGSDPSAAKTGAGQRVWNVLSF
jgi:hypothetical protein